MRARWYTPGSGTFLSQDAVELEPPYQYVRGNTINDVDPSGFCSGAGELSPYIDVMLDQECIGGPPPTMSGSFGPGPTSNSPVTQNIIKAGIVVIIRGCIYIIDYLSKGKAEPVEVNVAPQTKVDVNPGPETDPRLKPIDQCNCPVPLPTPTPQRPNQMRVQLQESRSGINVKTEGVEVVEQQPLGRGVTVRQVQAALQELYSRAPGLKWFKNTYMPDLRKAIIETSEELNRFPPGGYARGGNIEALSNQFPGPKGSTYLSTFITSWKV